jgi:16S rRNA (guanine527-N7)-methyltransferase
MVPAAADEADRLRRDAARLGVPLAPAQAAQLSRLLDELIHWNRAYNLTAITDREAMVTHHLLDSLAVLPHVAGTRVVDVGSGAGFPGLPLAIADPARTYVLIDSVGKKVRFAGHAARALGLANVTPLHARVEAHRPESPYDTIVARALAPPGRLVDLVRHLAGSSSRVLAMLGEVPDGLVPGARLGEWRAIGVTPIAVPGLDARRHLATLVP